MKKKKFNHKILIVGYGSVSQCTLPILLEKVNVPLRNITIIDFEDKSKALKKYTSKGLKYLRVKITKQNMSKVLSANVDKGGLLIDLAWNIGCNDIVKWCHDHEVLYVNTSVEQWDPMAGIDKKSPFEKSLYFRQMQLRELSKNWKNATTAVVDHGANPGLISHFVKQGLVDIAKRMIKDKKATGKDKNQLLHFIKNLQFFFEQSRFHLSVQRFSSSVFLGSLLYNASLFLH